MTSSAGQRLGLNLTSKSWTRRRGFLAFPSQPAGFFDRMQTDTLNSLHIRKFCESDQLEQYVPSAVQLIYEAAFSYFDLLFGGREEALAELSPWAKRESSEGAGGHRFAVSAF